MKKYNEINIGDSAKVIHTITERDIEKFVDLTGDDNKLHVNKEFAKKTQFKFPVVHGMLGASFISTLIGTKLPGDGALWFSQTLEFLRPVRVGDTITVQAQVTKKDDRLNAIELNIEILNQNKQIVTTGFSKVKVVEMEQVLVSDSNSRSTQKSVLIIGASGGVGRAVATKLANEGFDIFLHFHSNKQIVDRLKDEIITIGRKAIYCKANLLHDDDISNMVEMVYREFPELTAMVNCSTIKLPNIKFADLEWKDIQLQIDINIKCSFVLFKELMPLFEKQKYGKVVFLTTQAIETPNSEWLHYITAKSALNGFVKALAFEVASKGININMISPGMIDTELVADIPKKIKMLIEAKTPLKRLCKTSDVANAVAFLTSEASDYMTGETLRLNGGQVMI